MQEKLKRGLQLNFVKLVSVPNRSFISLRALLAFLNYSLIACACAQFLRARARILYKIFYNFI